MRLSAVVICVSLAAAAVTVIGAPADITGAAPASPDGPDPELCDAIDERAEIAQDFFLDACFDGDTLHIANRSSLPLQLSFEGDKGTVTKHQLGREGAPLAARAMNEAYSSDPGWLIPGYRLEIPVGTGALDVRIGTDDARARQYAYADLLTGVLPPTVAIDALIGAANELTAVYDQHIECLDSKGWIGDIGCEALYLRNVSFALGRLGVRIARGLVGIIAELIEQAEDAEQWVSDAVDLTEATTTLHVAGAPLRPAALLSAPVPSLCEHPAGRLVDGALPGIAEYDGGVWLYSIGWTSDDQEAPSRLSAFGDVTGDGEDDAVVTIGCFRGGVGWPDSVHVYTEGPTHHGQLLLVDAYDTGWEHRETVRSVQINDDGTFDVEWVTHAPGDAMCCASLTMRGTFSVDGDRVVTDELEVLADDRLAPDMAPGTYPDLGRCRDGEAPAASDGETGAGITAMCLYTAFALSDRDLASRYAEPGVVDTLFRSPWPVSPQDWRFYGCRAEASSLCTFTTSDISGPSDTVIDLTVLDVGGRLKATDAYIGADVGD